LAGAWFIYSWGETHSLLGDDIALDGSAQVHI